jgi:putative alpha-1,2-mannosidase
MTNGTWLGDFRPGTPSGFVEGTSAQYTPVHGLTVDGKPRNDSYIDFGALSHGATLSYDLASTPDPQWAAPARSAPPSAPADDVCLRRR